MSSYFLLSAAFVFLIFPKNYVLFLIVAGGHLIQTVTHLPTGSNHNFLSLFVTTGLAATYIQIALSERRFPVSPAKHFDMFVPLGRWVLLTVCSKYLLEIFRFLSMQKLGPPTVEV